MHRPEFCYLTQYYVLKREKRSSHSSSRDALHALHLIHQRLEAVRLVHGELRQHLAVHLDVLLLQPVDELAVLQLLSCCVSCSEEEEKGWSGRGVSVRGVLD